MAMYFQDFMEVLRVGPNNLHFYEEIGKLSTNYGQLHVSVLIKLLGLFFSYRS